MNISRRDFLGTTALAGAAASTLEADTGASSMPTRVLGRTGARVSILAFGAGSRFLSYKEDDQAIEALQKALDSGITYIDTSDDYGKDHLSEHRVGKAIQGRRGKLFIATKLSDRKGAESRRIVEASLKALNVDQVDLLHIHALLNSEDLAQIEAKGGVLEQLMKFRDEKLTRFIGITGHADPVAMKAAIEHHDFDCVQMALNAGMVNMMNGKSGMVPNGAMTSSFESEVLPVALRKKMGVLAIKTFAQDALLGQASPEKLLYYTLSLPVTAAVVGMPKLEHIVANAGLAKAFKPLPASEMKQMSNRLSEKNKLALDNYFRGHVDG
jgi:uncharacterized protein